MTNVKLKLTFLFLNALLTDFILAKPFPQNSNETSDYHNLTIDNKTHLFIEHNEHTVQSPDQIKKSKAMMEDIVNAEQGRDELITEKKITDTSNQTDIISIPIDPNADMLTVLKESNLKGSMEAIVNAEQDRDETMSEKKTKEPLKVLEIQAADATALEKQINISSSLLEKIIDSEMGREESLTNFAEAKDIPRYEFLIGAKLDASVNSSVSINNMIVDTRNDSDGVKRVDYVELVAVKTRVGDNKSSLIYVNLTGHEVDDDLAPDTRFTDLQTLVLACLGTLIPLLGVVCTVMFIRYLCRRCCPDRCAKKTDSTISESSESKSSDNQPIKATPEASSGTGEGDDEEAPTSNGSIITMTLKNNHLIVETEERPDVARNGRETKLKYSPDNDGIFVVEVQQSAVYKPTPKSALNSPTFDPEITTNQALIHRNPDEHVITLAKVESEEEDTRKSHEKLKEKGLTLSSTGLSISDLSLSSNGNTTSYSYGDQLGYEQGPFGYPIYAGYDIPKENTGEGILIHESSREPLLAKTPTDPDKPIVTAAIFKQDSIIAEEMLQGPGYSIEGSTDGPLLSDVQAREVSLQHLHDKKERKENGITIIEESEGTPKKSLNRADSLPVRLEEEKPDGVIDTAVVMETLKEEADHEEVISKEALKLKRASLPIIRTEMYDSVKEVFIPTGSPKFERFTDDPEEDKTLMITITEESDHKNELENGS